MTLFNQYAAVRPVLRPVQEPAIAVPVSETVPAAEADVESLNLTLAAAETAVLPPSKEDAGLSGPFLTTSASTGKLLNIKTYGATSNNSADDDATVINAVIKAAQAGDTVYIPNGTYHIKTTINLKSGVSLVGQSRDGAILAGAAGNTQPHAMVYAAPGVNNLTVSSFKITLASGAAFKAGVRVGYTDGAPVSRITVKNLYIEKFERFGILLQEANNVYVYGNTIKNATALGGGGQGYGITILGANSYNNWVRSNTIGPVIRHAILLEKAHHNLIEYNRITGTVSGAIDLHGEDEYANEIRYNTISDGVRNGTTVSPNGAGIEVGEYSGVIGTTTMHDNSGPGNYIHHNTVYNYSYGLRITNNSNYTYIEDNVFRNNYEVGILANLAPLNHLYLARNQVTYNPHGIILYGVTQAVVVNNIVRYNKGYGIGIDPKSTDYFIAGNTATNNGTNVYLMNTNGTYSPTAVAPPPNAWWLL
jgi:nitrous oxidase accessory protein NosD